jgi:prepilin-type N-terminal cleavage/methylation domain-containing protein
MKLQKQRGFTIVELLVVIVVIGILAAITIVSYTGVTAKANTSAAQANANSVIQVINACVIDTAGTNPCPGTYPTAANVAANIATYVAQATALAKMPYGVSVINGTTAAALTTANGKTTVGYTATPDQTGACISYLNFQSTPSTSDLGIYFAGSATAYTQTATGAIATCTHP